MVFVIAVFFLSHFQHCPPDLTHTYAHMLSLSLLLAERALHTRDPHAVHHVSREAEGHCLRSGHDLSLLEHDAGEARRGADTTT